jgi:hypothetical protein
MIYTLDTEFIDDGHTIDLLSIGVVCEDERTFYLQNCDAQFWRASPWVMEHVFPHLTRFDPQQYTPESSGTVLMPPWFRHLDISAALRGWIGTDPHPVFWGYYSAYDWVAFCQLFGALVDLPKGWPMYCRDLKQWSVEHGDIRFEKPKNMRHHALDDAQWIMEQVKRYVCQPVAPPDTAGDTP